MTLPQDTPPLSPPIPPSPAQYATAHPTPQTSRWQRFPSTRDLGFSLLALTALAAFLRYFRISYQCYWEDEAYTINRVHGSFRQMLASLSTQGFPPGWYALLRWWTLLVEYLTSPHHWWNHLFGFAMDPAFTALTPASTRSLTALFGTLTVPAMYLLARQFTDRKGALLVALLTAVNPYLIYYSRDIKMYEPTWFFIILNAALFFQWQTTHKHLLYFPLYLLTGFAMTAFHSTAWFLVALQLLFLFTRPRLKSLDGPLWVLAVGIMALLPLYWYQNGTSWAVDFAEHFTDRRLFWITDYTDMSWKTIASLPCAHLLGYLWPIYPPDAHIRSWFALGNSDFNQHAATRSLPWLAQTELIVALLFAAILLLGLFPWRGLRQSSERQSSVTQYRHWWLILWIILPPAALALTWIPTSSPWFKFVWGAHGLTRISPLWEPRYLGIIIPPLILWLAASLRRFPTWPLRTLLILFVAAASLASASSNYFFYRNPPYQVPAALAIQHYNPQNKKSLAVINLNLSPHLGLVIPVTYALARHVRPMTNGDWFLPNQNFEEDAYSPDQLYYFLRRIRTNPDLQTIIITDKAGDLTAPPEPLSNETLSEKLGPRWKLTEQKNYPLYFEWRFYIYETWRTRTYQRLPNPVPALTLPTTQPAPKTPTPNLNPNPNPSSPTTAPALTPSTSPHLTPGDSPGAVPPLTLPKN